MDKLNQQRILLVEDSPSVYTTLERRLTDAGYDVTLATNYPDAKNWLDTAHFHLAIFDMRLVDADEENQDGMRLLEYADQCKLRDLMPCVMLTGYPDVSSLLQATQDLHVTRFVAKDPGYIAKLLTIVRDLFDHELKINFDIEYDAPSQKRIADCAKYIHSAEDSPLPLATRLTAQVYDLLGKIFTGAKTLAVAQLIEGLSGAAVLYVKPQWRDGVGHPLVIKISRREKIEREHKNYNEYVARYMSADHHATVTAVCYTTHLGAISYTIANPDITQNINWEHLYQHRPTQKSIAALEHLFRHTCELWYKRSRRQPRLRNLRDLYFQAFQLTPERLPTEIRKLRPEITSNTPTICFDTPPLELPNPLRWLDNEGAESMLLATCITHGDLNAKNILINEDGECWLIDFYRTYRSHILRDFIELETDIKFRLMPVLAMEQFFRFERVLVELANPLASSGLGADASEVERKALHIIAALRVEAWRLLDASSSSQAERDARREYLSSLLIATMNIIRLRHFREVPDLQPQRERALLSAGLIYQEIQRLNTPGLGD